MSYFNIIIIIIAIIIIIIIIIIIVNYLIQCKIYFDLYKTLNRMITLMSELRIFIFNNKLCIYLTNAMP